MSSTDIDVQQVLFIRVRALFFSGEFSPGSWPGNAARDFSMESPREPWPRNAGYGCPRRWRIGKAG